MACTVHSLSRYPIKGLSGQPLTSVQLQPGCGFPCDRRFGFARPNSGFDPENPTPLPKTMFYMLARDATLALLKTGYEESTGILSMTTPGTKGEFDITGTEGKRNASAFLKSFLSLPENETPTLYEASPHRFTDVSVDSVEMMNTVSIVNLDSIEQFSEAIGTEISPNRFRANIVLAGLPPFSELDMVGHTIEIGAARLKIVSRTKRCPATEVDLHTGERNIKTPKLLMENYGHRDMGVYAEVVEGGVITGGDEVTPQNIP